MGTVSVTVEGKWAALGFVAAYVICHVCGKYAYRGCTSLENFVKAKLAR